MTIDHDKVWGFVPKLSKAEALVLLGFARAWDYYDERDGFGPQDGRLDPDDVATICGVAPATVGATLRKFSERGSDVGGWPAFVEPVYYLAAADGRTVPDRRVGYKPAEAIRAMAEPEPVDEPEDVPSFMDAPDPGT